MRFQLLICTAILIIQKIAANDIGYHYDPPTKPTQPAYNTRHEFAPLPTVVPLPPLPALPALPTAPPTYVQTHSQQIHPSVQTAKSIAAAYYTPQSKYLPPTASPYLAHPQQQQHQLQQQYSTFGQRLPAQTFDNRYTAPPATNNGQLQAVAQPLRVPYGTQALIHYPVTAPDANSFGSNVRQLKQYAVVEIIDNDIEQEMGPYLSSPFIDTFRARVGASGTGAIPPPPATKGIQIDTRANSLVLEQQRVSSEFRPAPGDAIALGSGGLGFVRLANGNIYLGSGSLGYISGQQHLQSVNEARTRSGASNPDALHFGHGPLSAFNYRYK